MSFRYLLLSCALAAATVSCAQPTPTPDIQATVDAAVRAALAAQAPPTPTSTPSSILTADEAEGFLRSQMSTCIFGFDLRDIQTEARYVGEGIWLVQLDGVFGANAPFDDFDSSSYANTRWRSGRWQLDESTGQLRPYDPTARLTEETGDTCARLFAARVVSGSSQ